MKNKLLIYLAGLLLLSSCAGTGIMKRRYSKGYYVSHAKPAGDPHGQQKTRLAKQAATPETQHTEVVVAPATAPCLAPPAVKALPVGELAKAEGRYARPAADPAIASAKANPPAVLRASQRPLQIQPVLMAEQRISDSSKVELLLMIILCLFPFINLIPVYLHDNDITLNFWLTLILDFTWIGGVIFALLVVLDVVNLAD